MIKYLQSFLVFQGSGFCRNGDKKRLGTAAAFAGRNHTKRNDHEKLIVLAPRAQGFGTTRQDRAIFSVFGVSESI
jgi:hypothetical protein